MPIGVKQTEKKCNQCGASFVLDTQILSKLHKLDHMMQGSKAWWNDYKELCDNCFEQCYGGVTSPDVAIMDKIEKHPGYKKWVKNFGVHSIAQLKEMGKACKTVK